MFTAYTDNRSRFEKLQDLVARHPKRTTALVVALALTLLAATPLILHFSFPAFSAAQIPSWAPFAAGGGTLLATLLIATRILRKKADPYATSSPSFWKKHRKLLLLSLSFALLLTAGALAIHYTCGFHTATQLLGKVATLKASSWTPFATAGGALLVGTLPIYISGKRHKPLVHDDDVVQKYNVKKKPDFKLPTGELADTFAPIVFDSNSGSLDLAKCNALKAIRTFMQQNPTIEVQIEGMSKKKEGAALAQQRVKRILSDLNFPSRIQERYSETEDPTLFNVVRFKIRNSTN